VAKIFSSTEKQLIDTLDAKKEYEPMLVEFLQAREDRDVQKIEKLVQQFIAITDARQIVELLDDPEMPFAAWVMLAEKFRKHYQIPPKQELDLGSITFSITRPREIEAEEPKKITYED